MLGSIDSAAALTALKSAGGNRGFVVHYTASWCEPCADVNSYLQSVTAQYPGVPFVTIDAEKLPEICETEDVDSVPHLSFYRAKEGAPAERVADIAGAKLRDVETNLISLFGTERDIRANHPTLEAYLTYLINKAKIVAFITGTPSRPRCGFTGKLMELLQAKGAAYVFYDVMASSEVCEGLKKFSDWPTYPQVYVEGQLVGGLDVCRELEEAGELNATLKL